MVKTTLNNMEGQDNDKELDVRTAIFRRQAEKYMMCFNRQCPRHEHCLRWQVGQYAPTSKHILSCISPVYERAATGQCEFYRDDTPQLMAKGMKGMFGMIPKSISEAIHRQLEATYGHTYFYEYKRGARLISPAMQEEIAAVFRANRWDEAPQFDGFEEAYNW